MSTAHLPPMDPALREIFRVAYLYRQKYQHPTEDPQFWSDAAAEMSALFFQLKSHPFARAILIACYEDIERDSRTCAGNKPERLCKPAKLR